MFRTLAASRQLNIVDSARLFAARTWPPPMPRSAAGTTSTTGTSGARSPPSARPRATETAATEADPTWTPLFDPSTPVAAPPALVTPPFPEHPSGHNCAAGSIVGTLQVLLRHRQDRLQRVQQQVRDHADLPPPLRRTRGEHQRTRVGRDPLPDRRPPRAPGSARRSRATSTTTTSNPSTDPPRHPDVRLGAGDNRDECCRAHGSRQVSARTATEQTTTRPEAGWSPPSKDATQATIALSPDRDSTTRAGPTRRRGWKHRCSDKRASARAQLASAPDVVPASAGARSEPDPLPHPPESRTALVPGCSAQFDATGHGRCSS